ncbi:MAG: DUF4062 domain-containing protein [Phaeospirillum sp.]|nr:DUF4062 domain-containing protein [Phaeospirillum sp.]
MARRLGEADNVCRVFISSTFEDLKEERSRLAQRVFPALRDRFAGEGVTVVDVDLRWGISEEQSRLDGTLNLCLTEVGNCVPYFIIILGGRYGWRPPIDPLAAVRHPWLTAYPDRSITELEIRSILDNIAAVRDSGGLVGAFCYLKNIEVGAADVDAEQVRLRQELMDSGLIEARAFASPDELEAGLQTDMEGFLGEMAQRLSASATIPEIVRSYHRTSVGQRTAGAENPAERIIGLEPAGHWVIHAGCGMGKTTIAFEYVRSLLARGYRLPPVLTPTDPASDATRMVIPVFLQYSNYGGHTGRMVQAILDMLPDSGQPTVRSAAATPLLLPLLLAELTERLAEKVPGGGTIVIDGIDACMGDIVHEDFEQFIGALPPGIRVVVTIDSANLDRLLPPGRRSLGEAVTVSALPPLPAGKALAGIERALAVYGKRLDDRRMASLAASPLRDNLRGIAEIADELRSRSTFASLDDDIARLGRAETLDELHALQLSARLEESMPTEATALRLVMAFLALSPSGLAEDLLRAVVMAQSPSLSSRDWSVVMVAVQPFVSLKDGRLQPADPDLRRQFAAMAFAVLDRAAVLGSLVDFLLHHPAGTWPVCEALRTLRHAGETERLDSCLADPNLVIALAGQDWLEFLACLKAALGGRPYWELAAHRYSERMSNHPAALALLAHGLEAVAAAPPKKEDDLAGFMLTALDDGYSGLLEVAANNPRLTEGADLDAIRQRVEQGRPGFRTLLHLAMVHSPLEALCLYRRGSGVAVQFSDHFRTDPAMAWGGMCFISYRTIRHEPSGQDLRVPDTLWGDRRPAPIMYWSTVKVLEEERRAAIEAMEETPIRIARAKLRGVLERGLTIAILMQDLDMASEVMSKVFDDEHGNLPRIYDHIRKCKVLQRAAAALGDFEAHCRFVSVQAGMALRSGNQIQLTDALAALDRIIAVNRGEGIQHFLLGIRNTVAEALASALGTSYLPDARDWRFNHVQFAQRWIRGGYAEGEAPAIDWPQVAALFGVRPEDEDFDTELAEAGSTPISGAAASAINTPPPESGLALLKEASPFLIVIATLIYWWWLY